MCSGLLVMLSVTHLQSCHGSGQLRPLHVRPGVELLAECDESHKGSHADIQGAWCPGGECKPEAAEGHSGDEDLHRYQRSHKEHQQDTFLVNIYSLCHWSEADGVRLRWLQTVLTCSGGVACWTQADWEAA